MVVSSGAAEWGDGTRCVHAGHEPPRTGAPLRPGPVFAAPYHLAGAEDMPAVPGAVEYGRSGNPSWTALEESIGSLDGGQCVLFPSGMAAISALLRAVPRPGDTVVLPADGYYGTRNFAAADLARTGVTVREVPARGPWSDEVLAGACLVLLETPANPGLDVCDIAALSAMARRVGALVAVDNTTATPLGQRPLELGADVVVASDTKALTGHSDLLLGHVSTADPELADRLRAGRGRDGSLPGPFEAWLAHRSLSTLDLRLARQAENAAALCAALEGHPLVTNLRWPGLPGDPSHAVARAQMRRFGGVFRFELPDASCVSQLVRRSSLLAEATSFGGVHSTVDRRAQWGDAVAPGFVRFSAGCEDSDDLVRDVVAALDGVARD
ncbi:cystathionine gamma-lyase [Actinoalloteichus sp. AHMU CJ021]|uniref:Cystathionine gamma-lyase n=1 Tax=Actinoalloteichus caeruleus DSM 43889 TaxID=1120930 RepID=A0ABT1JJZ0_ACTCY|nr:cystathionine gamma-lyase [Actinoalloteichus caeruleus]AUS78059.1 cystathionine gamma-lyase [Actinoalloteichus sp. AHMU CJ021]MCP2332051.1 cystathionine gamma-lyase [Actinoalloteichus caeruleus DSM 43889]